MDIPRIALENGLDINAHLSQEQLASVDALIALVESKLRFALDYEVWYETTTFYEITAKMRGDVYPWPLNYFIPRKERQSKIADMLSRMPVIQTNLVSRTDPDLCKRPSSAGWFIETTWR
jgi:hypothetical protein